MLPPMILPAAQPQAVVIATRAAPLPKTAERGRLADPPDTPPPIRAV
jgi:hypothetical protein